MFGECVFEEAEQRRNNGAIQTEAATYDWLIMIHVLIIGAQTAIYILNANQNESVAPMIERWADS